MLMPYRFWSKVKMRKGIQLQTESLKQHACLITNTSYKIQCTMKYIKGWLHSVA